VITLILWTSVTVLAGCTPAGPAEGGPTPSGSPAPAPDTTGPGEALAFTPDASRLPRTFDDAVTFAEAVAAGPADLGDDFTARQPPVEADPHSMAVLHDDCVWRREELPDGVLATVARHSERPAGDGRGALRVMASVTVHTSARAADERMAAVLEEGMRCPEQQLSGGERVTGVMSAGQPYGVRGQLAADDVIEETGSYHGDQGGPHPYLWSVWRLGPVTLALAVKGAEGYTEAELARLRTATLELMLTRVESELR
jgi:hypothetical protein